MDTNGDSVVTGRGVAEAQMRYDAVWRRMLRVAARYDSSDELDAAAAMALALQAMAGTEELAQWLGTLAVWARRNGELRDEHPAAAAAVEALNAVRAGKHGKAEEIVARTLREHPGTVELVVGTWARAFDRHATGGRPGLIDADIPTAAIDEDGAVVEPAELPEKTRWALAVLKAYMCGDQDGFNALIAQLYDGDGPNLLPALARAVATTMDRFPRGWAWDDGAVRGLEVPG